jgi:hypothetical protein
MRRKYDPPLAGQLVNFVLGAVARVYEVDPRPGRRFAELDRERGAERAGVVLVRDAGHHDAAPVATVHVERDRARLARHREPKRCFVAVEVGVLGQPRAVAGVRRDGGANAGERGGDVDRAVDSELVVVLSPGRRMSRSVADDDLLTAPALPGAWLQVAERSRVTDALRRARDQ